VLSCAKEKSKWTLEKRAALSMGEKASMEDVHYLKTLAIEVAVAVKASRGVLGEDCKEAVA
jgi:hypothetical protein